MFINLIILFTVIPVIELAVLIKIGGIIGTFKTVAIILITGIWGAALAKSQGFIVLRRIKENMAAGIAPTEELYDGAIILVGGALLLTPGFVTDFLGLFLLIPQTRYFVKKYLKIWIKKKIDAGTIYVDRDI